MILYILRQNKNTSSKAYGLWFAYPVIEETVDLDALAEHMSNHNTPYSKGAITGMLKDMVSCIKELLLEGKNVKIADLAIFSLGIKNNCGAVSEEAFTVSKNIKGVKLRARATGELISKSLNLEATLKKASATTKSAGNGGTTGGGSTSGNGSNNGSQSGSGSITGGDSQSGSGQSGNGGNTNSGSNSGGSNSGCNSGSQSGTGSITGGDSQSGSGQGGNGGNTNSGSNSGGSNSGGSNSGSQSGSDTGSGEPGNYRLVIYKYGSGTSTVTDDSEQELANDSSVASGSNVNISVVPAEGKVPTAKINGSTNIALTENDGVYTGSFVMPTKGTVLEINSEPSDIDWGDDH